MTLASSKEKVQQNVYREHRGSKVDAIGASWACSATGRALMLLGIRYLPENTGFAHGLMCLSHWRALTYLRI